MISLKKDTLLTHNPHTFNTQKPHFMKNERGKAIQFLQIK